MTLRQSMLSLSVTAFLVCSAILSQAQAQTTESPMTGDKPTVQTTTRADRDFDWGWLGLLGLLGLGGLAGRNRDTYAVRRRDDVRR
jgi:hypothetical protein